MAAGHEWKEGALCELYIDDDWTDGKVIKIFEDDKGKCVRLKYGQRIIDLDSNDRRIRPKDQGNSWVHISYEL